VCPSSHPPPAARSTWSPTAAPGCWFRRAAVEGRTWAAVGDQLLVHYEDVLAARRTAVAA
jgi:hypothetical protein